MVVPFRFRGDCPSLNTTRLGVRPVQSFPDRFELRDLFEMCAMKHKLYY
jgi:hypothetical protein